MPVNVSITNLKGRPTKDQNKMLERIAELKKIGKFVEPYAFECGYWLGKRVQAEEFEKVFGQMKSKKKGA